MNPSSLGHLPLLMLGSGFGGVVGTYCGVPSLFAQAFARRFYGTFVNGVPLGRALLKTRQDSLFYAEDYIEVLITANPGFKFVKTGWRGNPRATAKNSSPSRGSGASRADALQYRE